MSDQSIKNLADMAKTSMSQAINSKEYSLEKTIIVALTIFFSLVVLTIGFMACFQIKTEGDIKATQSIVDPNNLIPSTVENNTCIDCVITTVNNY